MKFKFNNQSQSQEDEKNSLICPIIQKHHVQKSQIQIDHVICSICHNVLWKPVICGAQNGCHNSFCSNCIKDWIQNLKQKQLLPNCPNCKLQFISCSPHPILKSILSNLSIQCQNTINGCNNISSYNQIQSHLKICQYSLKKCTGCKKQVLIKDYENHTNFCQKYMIQCQKCKSRMLKRDYLKRHISFKDELTSTNNINNKELKQVNQSQSSLVLMSSQNNKSGQNNEAVRSTQCYQFEVNNYDLSLSQLQERIQKLNTQFNRLEGITNNFIMFEPICLNLTFYTSFNQHFKFDRKTQKKLFLSEIKNQNNNNNGLSQKYFQSLNSTLITLSKASYNQQKQKNDFLHFYISNSIYLQNFTSRIKWKIKLAKMSGNILIGFCNSMNINSLDYIINKHGELKRKSQTQNRYKIIKKYEQFTFSQGNMMTFELKRKNFKSDLNVEEQERKSFNIKIRNQTKNCQIFLSEKQSMIQQFQSKSKIYAFYSLDTLNDSIQFFEGNSSKITQ